MMLYSPGNASITAVAHSTAWAVELASMSGSSVSASRARFHCAIGGWLPYA